MACLSELDSKTATVGFSPAVLLVAVGSVNQDSRSITVDKQPLALRAPFGD